MKAARMYGVNDIRVEECAIPQIGPDEILLKVKAAAICGTDLRMIQNGDKRIDREHPRILGHEISGIIEAVGEKITLPSVSVKPEDTGAPAQLSLSYKPNWGPASGLPS